MKEKLEVLVGIERKPDLPEWQRWLRRIAKDKALYIMLVPFIAYYLIFFYKPMAGLVVAFQDYSVFKGVAGSPWVGLDNFIAFFQDPYFYRILRNTLLISLFSLFFGFPVPIILALLLNEVRKAWFKKTIQTMTYMPHFISIVVVVGIVTHFLAPTNGLINQVISMLGGEKIYFLTKAEYFRTIYITMNVWKEAGFSAIIYFAALSGINSELYEASYIDGANRWKQTLHVTIPGLLPTVMIMLLLRIGDLLEVGHETILLLYQPATFETADIISTYVYRMGVLETKYGFSTAVGMFNSLVGLILIIFANRLSKRLTDSSLW